MKISKRFIHDIFFKEIYADKRYSLDIFKLVLTKTEYSLFDWKTLKSELTSFVDTEQREKRMDLTFSVKLKRGKQTARILFLLEHKSYRNDDLLVQMLEYQTGIYRRTRTPVIPILVYHGKEKKWRGVLNFQDSLKGLTPTVRRKFQKNILNFTCKLLNIRELNIRGSAKKLVTAPVLLILQQIWKLDANNVEEFFLLSQHLPDKERRDLIMKASNYIRKNDPGFHWHRLIEIEEKVITEKGERIMFSLKDTLDEVKEEGRQEGIEKGIKKGKQEVALKLVKKGFDLEDVADSTGVPKDDLEKLCGSLK